jgi:TatD DNase family protein
LQEKINMTPAHFDIHSHLNFKDFDKDRGEVIAKLKEGNIWTTTVGTNLETSKQAVWLADRHENLFATIGLHPVDDPAEIFDEQEFEKLVTNKKVVAIGECGLDYARMTTGAEAEKVRQKKEFEKQIAFALKHDKPLMIHCRDAFPDTLAILSSKKKEYGDKLRGNFHFFSSPVDIAKQCLELGFTVSFTGPITFVSDYADTVSFVPLEKMMAETDAPFAAPVPRRGKRNEPQYVEDIVRKIAEIKKEDFEKVRQALVDNTLRFFGLQEV